MDVRKKIMIVEDQQVLLDLYTEKFSRHGYEVLGCTNGLEAVTKLDGFRPDAILLDIMMPQMDGFETLRVIRRLAPSIGTKIMVFSNLSGKEHIERCMELGADGYVVKAETTPGEVYEKIESMMPVPVVPEEWKPESEASEHPNRIVCPCCGTEFPIER